VADNGLLQHTLRGWQLFPVKPRNKRPLIAEWQHQATDEEEQLWLWQKTYPDCNWAAVTGPRSGMFVLDVDGDKGLKALIDLQRMGCYLPETLTTHTARGKHAFFQWPAAGTAIRNSAGKLAPGLDVRGTGGYVLVPPSVHPSGVPYEFVDGNAPIAPADEWLLEMLEKNSAAANPLLDVERHRANIISQGQRNTTLMSLAGSMRSKAVTQPTIEATLLAENKERCQPPLDDEEVRQIARSAARYEPATAKREVVLRRPELLTLSAVTASEVDWLWKPYLAIGMLAMLSGDPGAGKTFIGLAVAAAITVGRIPCTGEQCVPAQVLYLSVENSPAHVLRPRFDSLGGNPECFHLLRGSVTGDGERGDVRLSDVSLLGDALRETQARLVIVDPIQSYLGAKVDAHRSNETRPVMDGLSRLAEEYGCCILLVRHLGKAPTGKAIHRGLGSIDLTGAVRTELLAGCAPDDPAQRALVQLKSNLGQLGPSLGYTIEADGAFRWTGESQLTASAILAPELNGEESGAMAEAQEFLLSALAQGSRSAKDVMAEARQEGITERTLKRAKKELRVFSQKGNMREPWEWGLPEAGQQ
jgi:Bifunctional DNA primase/polymerase, N-terminal/AAA domain/Primase C terminal 1 (PriCT-1)